MHYGIEADETTIVRSSVLDFCKEKFNAEQPKLLSIREIHRIFFPLNYEILSFGKCLNNKISRYQRSDIFSNYDNTKLKRSSIFFLLPNGIAGR